MALLQLALLFWFLSPGLYFQTTNDSGIGSKETSSSLYSKVEQTSIPSGFQETSTITSEKNVTPITKKKSNTMKSSVLGKIIKNMTKRYLLEKKSTLTSPRLQQKTESTTTLSTNKPKLNEYTFPSDSRTNIEVNNKLKIEDKKSTTTLSMTKQKREYTSPDVSRTTAEANNELKTEDKKSTITLSIIKQNRENKFLHVPMTTIEAKNNQLKTTYSNLNNQITTNFSIPEVKLSHDNTIHTTSSKHLANSKQSKSKLYSNFSPSTLAILLTNKQNTALSNTEKGAIVIQNNNFHDGRSSLGIMQNPNGHLIFMTIFCTFKIIL